MKPKLDIETQNSNAADISKKCFSFIGSVVVDSFLLRGTKIIIDHLDSINETSKDKPKTPEKRLGLYC